ncbi:DUF6299 family protein [Streptomyces sp. NPDC006551]|uniref:DUF6299 family protein n=1 Tax=Streptomyces sp. NPDC006551 TaxID=3157178 RepID=UPI00339E45F4
MRVRLALAASTLVVAATATATAVHAAPADDLSVDAYGTVADDGTVALSGTYRCSDDSAGPVMVGTTLVQSDLSSGIGGTRAVCDGQVRAWSHSGTVKDPAYQAGAARVKAALMQLTPTGPLGLPMPNSLAAEESDVTLR